MTQKELKALQLINPSLVGVCEYCGELMLACTKQVKYCPRPKSCRQLAYIKRKKANK